MAQTTPDPSINQCTQFSYLGVPVATGMDDFYENEFRHRPATPTTVARTTTAQGPKRNVALGLVPRRGGERQNHHTIGKNRHVTNFILLAGIQGRRGRRNRRESSSARIDHTRVRPSSADHCLIPIPRRKAQSQLNFERTYVSGMEPNHKVVAKFNIIR